jgi:hypothetical protein
MRANRLTSREADAIPAAWPSALDAEKLEPVRLGDDVRGHAQLHGAVGSALHCCNNAPACRLLLLHTRESQLCVSFSYDMVHSTQPR